jgi:hypothetical protein
MVYSYSYNVGSLYIYIYIKATSQRAWLFILRTCDSTLNNNNLSPLSLEYITGMVSREFKQLLKK